MEQIEDGCQFLNAAHTFAARHTVGDNITPISLQPLTDARGIPEKSGKWPHETRAVRCSSVCDGRVVMQVEYDQLASDVAWHGGCIVVKAALEAERKRLSTP